MKSVASLDGSTLYVNGWGFPQNQPGRQVADGAVRRGTGALRHEQGRRRRRRPRSSATSRWTRCWRRDYGFPAFDLDRNDRLDAREWDVLRSMLASENGLLAVSLGGQGDMTASAIKWRYQRPVPQVPSTLLYKGVLFMVNDSGILISFDPGNRSGAQAGPPEGRHRQVLRLTRRRRRPGLAGQPGRHRLGRVGQGRVGDSRPSTRWTTRCSRRRRLPTGDSTSEPAGISTASGRRGTAGN